MKHARRRQGKGAFDLIEEAVHLLRTSPLATLAVYYLGAIPFVLGLLFFWADMSRSPFANQHLADASFAMAALFFWMKFWQAVFARRLRSQIAAEPPPALNLRLGARIIVTQTIVQPFGLFLIPLLSIPLLSFAWVYAFYQNVTVAADYDASPSNLFKRSWQQATLWPAQNWMALGILLLFGFCVFDNFLTVGMMIPQLLKMFFGIESLFTRGDWLERLRTTLFNTTFLAAMFGLTYLCVDPIVKAFYALRCFYGESLQSGEDLRAELKPFVVSAKKIAAAILILSAIYLSVPARAAEAAPPANPPTASQVSPPDLDRAINQTIHEQKYTWRLPRGKIEEADANEGIVARFFDKVGAMLRKWARAVLDWLDTMLQKLFRRWHPGSSGPRSNWDWGAPVQLLLWTLVAAVAATLGVFLYRVWRGRQKTRTAVASEAMLPVPDVADENVGADQLPEDGWTKLARELLERGEFRLALRAFFLASLSHLAARNLIAIARFKSNRDYERELRRRGHSFPEMLSLFGDNLSVFERIWYGMHEVNRELVGQFSANVEKIKSGG